MRHATKLSFTIVATLAACAVDDSAPPQDVGRSGTVTISDEDGTDEATRFVVEGRGHAASSAVHTAVVESGVIRLSDRDPHGRLLELATDAVRRSVVLDATARAAAVRPDGALAIDRGAVTELVANRPDGVEQSWRFAAPPRGTADLVVTVRASGFAGVTRSANGLRFDAWHYSDATWIDADGERTAIPVAWERDRIVIRVPAHVVDGSAYPAVLDPTVSTAASVEPLVTGFSGGRARQPSIAPSSNRYLAVWRDDRSGYTSDIFASRINTDGTLQDVGGLQITTTGADEGAPKVVWISGMNRWLVVWSVDATSLAAALVAPDKTVTPLGAVPGATAVAAHDLAADTDAALLVYQSGAVDADGDVYAIRFDGTAFGAPIAIAADPAQAEENPAVTDSNGGNFLVAYQRGAGANIRGQLVTLAGALEGTAITVSNDAGVQSTPSADWSGTSFVVAWKHAPTEIWATRVAPDGTVLDVTGAVGGIAVATGTTILTNPAVGCDGTNCIITWEDRRDTINLTTGIFGQRRAPDFTTIGGIITINDATRSQNNLAMEPREGGGYFMVFDDRAVGIHNISLVRTNVIGPVLDAIPILVSRGSRNSHRAPGFARSPVGQLATWQDSRRFGDDIMALRYSATGAKIDGTFGARVVSDAANTQNTPSIDFDGTNYLIAWSDTRNATFDVFAARFLDDGSMIDPGGIALSTLNRNQLAPDVASSTGSSLVVWGDESQPTNGSDIVGAIVQADGSFTRFDICRQLEDQAGPEVAWDPTNNVYVVVWADFRSTADFDLYATRVQPNGTVLDGCGVLVAGGAADQRAADIASSGSQVLVVWEDYATDATGDIRAARLTTGGGLTVVDAGGLAIATGAAPQMGVTVGGLSDGRWSLAWEDWGDTATNGSDIVGNELSAAGALLGPQYDIAASVEWEHGAHLQSGVNTKTQTYILYQKTTSTTQIVRVFRRKIAHPVP